MEAENERLRIYLKELCEQRNSIILKLQHDFAEEYKSLEKSKDTGEKQELKRKIADLEDKIKQEEQKQQALKEKLKNPEPVAKIDLTPFTEQISRIKDKIRQKDEEIHNLEELVREEEDELNSISKCPPYA